MSNTTFVFHGSFGSPYENWFPWLHGVLAARGDTCFAPPFPTPVGQTFESWARIVDAYRDNGLLNEESTLVTHSSSAVFAVKYLTSRQVGISKLITVSGFNQFFSGNEDFDRINSEFFVTEQDLKATNKYCKKAVSFLSSTDPYLPTGVLISFASTIGAETIDVPSAGHFNSAAGFAEFPQILEHL